MTDLQLCPGCSHAAHPAGECTFVTGIDPVTNLPTCDCEVGS
jgi:hypothetical protein